MAAEAASGPPGAAVERDQVGAHSFDEAGAHRIQEAAAALGMVDAAEPPRAAYTHMLILGALAVGCLQRTEYAAALAERIRVGRIAALGSYRRLGEHEKALLAQFGERGCEYEVDAMDAGVRRAFGRSAPTSEHATGVRGAFDAELDRQFAGRDLTPVDVLAAPSSQPEARRANTPDSLRYWAGRVALAEDDWVLVVTTPIYVPFQHADAVAVIGREARCGIHTVGFDPKAFDDPRLPTHFGPERLLQEVRSAVRSLAALYARVASEGTAAGATA
jgi:hypothetical protein